MIEEERGRRATSNGQLLTELRYQGPARRDRRLGLPCGVYVSALCPIYPASRGMGTEAKGYDRRDHRQADLGSWPGRRCRIIDGANQIRAPEFHHSADGSCQRGAQWSDGCEEWHDARSSSFPACFK